MNRWLYILLAAAVILAGCSREGFSSAVAARPQSSVSESSHESSSGPDESHSSQIAEFSLGSDIIEDTGIYIDYAPPRAMEDWQQDAVDTITSSMTDIMYELIDHFDMSADGAKLDVYGNIHNNDGIYYSLSYDVSYRSSSDAEKQELVFGLTFDSKTGERVSLSDVMDTSTLPARLLDAQSVNFMGNEDNHAAWQEELDSLGRDGLSDIIEANAAQSSIDELLNFSFAMEEDRTAIFIKGESGYIKLYLS